MFDLVDRIRKFDPRKLTPTQIVLGVIGIIIVIAILNFVLQLANTLLPFAVVGLVAFFVYRLMNSRSPAEEKQDATADDTAQQQTAADSHDEDAFEAQRDEAMAREAQEAASRMSVAPKTNPDTGIEEADLDALLEKEQRLMDETKQVNDDVMAQLEARRKRLLKGDDGDAS